MFNAIFQGIQLYKCMYQGILHSSKDSKNRKRSMWCNRGFWWFESGIGEKHFETHWDIHQENHSENKKVENKHERKEM